LATDKAIEMILERFQTPQSVGAPESITVGSE
jgi:hypothetical protein